jgi:hypothetical protein
MVSRLSIRPMVLLAMLWPARAAGGPGRVGRGGQARPTSSLLQHCDEPAAGPQID